MSSDIYALVDCNNFFVSCERVFNPQLRDIPVVVLSNNDGCIIARSNEAKEFGIPMGAPVFEWKEIIDKNNITMCSSNFSLYQDMSERVFRALSEFCEQIEIYSVDEAFLRFSGLNYKRQKFLIHDMKSKVYQWTGIPISVGISSTKTLAKLANKIAKEFSWNEGIYEILNLDSKSFQKYIMELKVDSIWGIGYRNSKKLKMYNISTIIDFINSDPQLLKQKFGVQTERTWLELHGIRCYSISTNRKEKQGILCSRTFKQACISFRELEEAIATFSARVCSSLRKQNSLALSVGIFVTSGKHSQLSHFYKSKEKRLQTPTSHTPTITKNAIQALREIYVSGLKYKRAGVYLSNFYTENEFQRNMFESYDLDLIKRNYLTMQITDSINKQWGKDTLMFGNQRINRPQVVEQSLRSPKFTTDWKEIRTVYTNKH